MRRVSILAAVAAVVLALVPTATASPGLHTEIVPGTRAFVTDPVQALGFELGRLQIPKIGVDETVREGVHINVIDQGVAHWAGTAQAGGYGNVVLAGHRTVRSRPFHDLDRLGPGDEIVLTGLDGQEVAYRVRETLIVAPNQTWIADWTRTPTLTLFACHPKGSARQRIVVRADLVDVPLQFP